MNHPIKIDGFQKIEKIVTGSYWSLYRAWSIHSDTRHLVQVLDATSVLDATLVSLFKNLRETRQVLHHDNILTPIAYDETGVHKYLLYDDVDALSLQAEIVAGHDIPEHDVLSVVRQTTEALQFAQIRGLSHGWVTPEVILRSQTDGSVKIFGFGSEKIFSHLYDKRPDIAVFLNPYIPPEHLGQAEEPAPNDCYALGVTFYQAVTNTLPFDAERIVDLVNQKMTELPPAPLNARTTAAVAQTINALLDPKPHRRATYSSLLNELNPQEDTIAPVDRPEYEKETGLSKVRDLVSDINPLKDNVTGPRKIAYITAAVVFFLVSIISIFVVARLVSNDKKRVQQIYAEYLADQHYEQRNDIADVEWQEKKEQPNGESDRMIDADNSERNVYPSDSVENATVEQPDAPAKVTTEQQSVVQAQKAELAVSVSANSENVTAEIFVDGQRYGYSSMDGECIIADLLVNKTYKIRVVRDGWQPWEKPVSIKDGENTIVVKLQPEVAQYPSFTFAAVSFADQIKINDQSVARNLPCTIQAPPGKINVTYIESKAGFFWITSFDLNENETTLSVSAEQVGKGDIVVVLNDPIQYGYAFVKIDENDTEHTTPFRSSLTVGWHRIQVFRDNYTISPADTSVFIRPGVKLDIRCNVR